MHTARALALLTTTIPLAAFCAPRVTIAQAAGAREESGYPIEEYLGVTGFGEVAVSPDAAHVAFVASADDLEEDARESAIWRVDFDSEGRKTGMVRLASSTGSYSGLQWSEDGRFLFFIHGEGEEKPQLYAVDMRGGEPRRITDPEHHADGIGAFDLLPGADLVFAARVPETEQAKEAREAFYGDVMRFVDEPVETRISRIERVAEDEAGELITTVELAVSQLRASPDGSRLALTVGPSPEPQPFTNDFGEAEIYLLSVGEPAAPQRLTENFVVENALRWRAEGGFYAAGLGQPGEQRFTQGRLFTIDPQGRVEHLTPDFAGSFYAPYVTLSDGTLLAPAAVSTRTNLYRVEPRTGDVEALSDFTGAVSNLAASPDGDLIAFALITDRSAGEIYVARGVENLSEAEPVTEFNAALARHPTPEVEAISWSNGEGDQIEGILFWPPGQRGETGLPLVVDIHGGPWSLRTENLGPMSFAYYPALLASRGYLVLETNYRGGTGRDEEFLQAIEGYSCTRPATDVLTGVDHLVERGWADPDRMAVMGYSYGGLMTNCIIGLTDRFRAAASGAGIWNDISYFGTADNFVQNDVRNRAVAPWENLENYWNESAISRAGAITTPTLVTIGGADRRVPTAQGFELYRALVRLGVPTELLVFPGEPHGFQKPKHKLTKVKAELQWIERWLTERETT